MIDYDEWEKQVEEACKSAELSPVETELALLYYVEEMSLSQVRRKLKAHLRSPSEAQATLARVQGRLSRVEGFWDAAKQFQRDLVRAVENRADYDDRPAGVCGVASAEAAKRFQGVNVFSPTHPILRQPLPDAARLYMNSLRPVSDEERAFAGAR